MHMTVYTIIYVYICICMHTWLHGHMRTVVQTHPSSYPRRTALHNRQETGHWTLLSWPTPWQTQEPSGTFNARKMLTNRMQRFKLAQNSNIINQVSQIPQTQVNTNTNHSKTLVDMVRMCKVYLWNVTHYILMTKTKYYELHRYLNT